MLSVFSVAFRSAKERFFVEQKATLLVVIVARRGQAGLS